MTYIFPSLRRQLAIVSVLVATLTGGSTRAQEPVGPCAFDIPTLSFAGTPIEQAECLMQKVRRGGELRPQRLPALFRGLLETAGSPSPAQAAAALAAFSEPYRSWAAERAQLPASQTEAGVPLAYFVIHDTSMPFLGERPFPADLDRDAEVNDLNVYVQPEPVAHIFLNRAGQIWPGHDLSRPWRATKLETRVAGVPARGRFVHIELVQPRRHAPGSTSLSDTLAPRPGFSQEQYRLLAALYVHASARAGQWLIPSQHATLDAGMEDAHDDPQNFDVSRFAEELAALLPAQERTKPRKIRPSP
jgi:hypothetical protein